MSATCPTRLIPVIHIATLKNQLISKVISLDSWKVLFPSSRYRNYFRACLKSYFIFPEMEQSPWEAGSTSVG